MIVEHRVSDREAAVMRIAETQIAISVFVCVDEEVAPGTWARISKATAFLTTIKGDPFWTGYVVTAAHVIEGAGNRSLYLRANTDDGFDDIEIYREEWFIHDHSDVAIVRVNGPERSHTSCTPYILRTSFVPTSAYKPQARAYKPQARRLRDPLESGRVRLQ
jgi:hypothetical protein